MRDCVLLYVEDDDATAYLFQMALEEAGIQAKCLRVTDGEQALNFILRWGVYTEAPAPDKLDCVCQLGVGSSALLVQAHGAREAEDAGE